MKIVHIMGMESTKYGGLEKYNVAFAKQCTDCGYSIFFVYEELPEVTSFVDDLKCAGGKLVIINSRKSYLKFTIQLIMFILKEKPDIVHTHFMMARFISIPLLLLFKVPAIFQTLHSGINDSTFSKKTMKVNRFFLKSRVNTLAVSKGVRHDFCSRCNVPEKRIAVHNLGVDVRLPEANSVYNEFPEFVDKLVILSISNFNKVKGLDILVEAFEGVYNIGEATKIELLIVGQPQDQITELENTISSFKSRKHIRMLGIRSDIAKFLAIADIQCQPSRHEGIPLAVMEGLSAGLPVIATDIGGLPEVVETGYNGILVEKENVESLKDAIVRLITDTDLREKMAQNSKVKSNEFRMETSINRLIKRYEEYFNIEDYR